MDELNYEDVDGDGNPLQYAGKKEMWQLTIGCDPKWETKRAVLFKLTGRKFFARGQKHRWKKICNELNSGHMPVEWLDAKIDWVRSVNKEQVSITFSSAMSAIENVDLMLQFIARHKLQAKAIPKIYQAKDLPSVVGDTDLPDIIE